MEKLTNQEEDIMLRIWKLGRCAVKQIMELLHREKHINFERKYKILNEITRKHRIVFVTLHHNSNNNNNNATKQSKQN